MAQYSELLRALGLPTPLISCAEGEIRPPGLFLDAPAEWYVFPPALIPLWSDGSSPSYIGYWKHWFLKRGPSFVEMYVEAQCMTIEIARTPEQLFCVPAIRSLCVRDGVDDEIRAFARAVGIENLAELNQYTAESGDDPRGFWRIEQFRTKTPLASVANISDYTGDFPTGVFSGLRPWWTECCSCELPEGRRWPEEIERPEWLVEGQDMPRLFSRYLADGDLARAWLTLNSTGWQIPVARQALLALGEAAHNPMFYLVVAAWVAITDGDPGGY